jgi:hypothetical protein
MFVISLEKLSLITSEECIESNVIPVEAMKFLEDETPDETVNNAATTTEQDGEDEDLVCSKYSSNKIVYFISLFILVRSYLNQNYLQIHKQHNCIIHLDIPIAQSRIKILFL